MHNSKTKRTEREGWKREERKESMEFKRWVVLSLAAQRINIHNRRWRTRVKCFDGSTSMHTHTANYLLVFCLVWLDVARTSRAPRDNSSLNIKYSLNGKWKKKRKRNECCLCVFLAGWSAGWWLSTVDCYCCLPFRTFSMLTITGIHTRESKAPIHKTNWILRRCFDSRRYNKLWESSEK